MHVDEAGRHDEALDIDLALAFAGDPAERGNLVAIDSEIAMEPGIAGPIDDLAVTQDQVEAVGVLSGTAWIRQRKESDGEQEMNADQDALHGSSFHRSAKGSKG